MNSLMGRSLSAAATICFSSSAMTLIWGWIVSLKTGNCFSIKEGFIFSVNSCTSFLYWAIEFLQVLWWKCWQDMSQFLGVQKGGRKGQDVVPSQQARWGFQE